MVRNLNQLKRELRCGMRFEIIGHCRTEYIGQLRRVTLANTACFYSVVDGQPEHLVSRANGGKGFALWWGKASCWEFHDGLCSAYGEGQEHTEQNLLMSFRILEEDS